MKLIGLIFVGYKPIQSVIHLTEKDCSSYVRLFKALDKVYGTMSYFMKEVFNGSLHGLVASF